jgi:hypothetical protein
VANPRSPFLIRAFGHEATGLKTYRGPKRKASLACIPYMHLCAGDVPGEESDIHCWKPPCGHASREHHTRRAERLGDDGRMVAERRRQHAGADKDARSSGAERAQQRQRKGRMAVDVFPWLKVIADEDRIEPDFLGKTREAQQLARRANCSADALYPSLITANLLAGVGLCRCHGTRRGNL